MLPFRPRWCLHTHNTTGTKSDLKLLPRGSEQQQICILCEIKSVFNEKFLKDSTSPVTLVHLWTGVSAQTHSALSRGIAAGVCGCSHAGSVLAGDKWTLLRAKRPRSHIQCQSSQVCTSPQRAHVHILQRIHPEEERKKRALNLLPFRHICRYSYLCRFHLNSGFLRLDFMTFSTLFNFNWPINMYFFKQVVRTVIYV